MPRRSSRGGRVSFSFDEVLVPAVRFGVSELRRSTPSAVKRVLANSAWDDLSRHLSARLTFALTPTLRFYQKAAKAVARSMQTTNRAENRDAADRITLLETFQEFPDLLETANRLIFAWIEAQRELLTRLWKDRVDISSILLRHTRRFRVVGIRPGLSDPHDAGRSVTLIQFDDARRVIYKPRPCDGEQFWFDALAWLNRNGIPAPFRIPILLARKNYTWMEFLRTKNCRNRSTVRLFYFRWGVQAALAQILEAADLHRENWLAVGSQPILVDAELIGNAKVAREEKASLDRHLPALLRTGLLPITARDRVGFYRGIAPFDEAVLEKAPANCWPRCRGMVERPSRYVEELAAGFKAMTDLFSSRPTQEDFFKEIILRVPRHVRALPRATAQYARLLRESLEARNMISSGHRWRFLTRECVATAVNRTVGRAEARSLLRGDIPRFTARQSAAFLSRKSFFVRVAQLKRSLRLLRSRVVGG